MALSSLPWTTKLTLSLPFFPLTTTTPSLTPKDDLHHPPRRPPHHCSRLPPRRRLRLPLLPKLPSRSVRSTTSRAPFSQEVPCSAQTGRTGSSQEKETSRESNSTSFSTRPVSSTKELTFHDSFPSLSPKFQSSKSSVVDIKRLSLLHLHLPTGPAKRTSPTPRKNPFFKLPSTNPPSPSLPSQPSPAAPSSPSDSQT